VKSIFILYLEIAISVTVIKNLDHCHHKDEHVHIYWEVHAKHTKLKKNLLLFVFT